MSSFRVESLAYDIARQRVGQSRRCDGFIVCRRFETGLDQVSTATRKALHLLGSRFATSRTVALFHFEKLQH